MVVLLDAASSTVCQCEAHVLFCIFVEEVELADRKNGLTLKAVMPFQHDAASIGCSLVMRAMDTGSCT